MEWHALTDIAAHARAVLAASAPATIASQGTAEPTWQQALECANDIATLLSGALTPIIALIALYIAWRQHKTAQDNLKLNLYDRRFKVFRGLMDLLGAVLRDVGVSQNDLATYYSDTNEKKFLFDDDIVAFMAEVRAKAVELRQVKRQLEEQNNMPEEKRDALDALIEKDHELLTWFGEQADTAAEKFDKYLGFKRNL